MDNLDKKQKIIIIIILIIVLGIFGYYIYGRDENKNDITNDEEMLVKTEEQTKEAEEKIVVHIIGAVNKEGVVTLDESSRIVDAVNAAGGLRDDADMSKINLAYILEDGMKIIIPSVNDKELEENTENEQIVESIPESIVKSEKSQTSLININKASQAELETLPGIGPSIALKIVNYREENGKFSSIEDLKSVSGIGESKFENIKKLICIK